MGSFFAYSLQSAICLAAFYLFFKVLLSRDTFHRFNRIALLGILALSLIIPIVSATIYTIIPPEVYEHSLLATSEFVSSEKIDTVVESANVETGNIYLAALLLIYLSGCVICLFITGISIIQIIRTIRKGECIKTDDGTKIIITDNKETPSFSWMNYIVLSRRDYDEAGTTIITHEKAHISLHHTYDLMIAQACIVMQWFNPAAWLLYQEIQNIHEYEADEKVLRQGVDARQYQLLLIKKAVGTRLYSMANSFNHSNLKKRITMMLQKKSNSWARLKYTYVLPLAAIIIAACTNKETVQKIDELSNAKISQFASDSSTDDVKNLSGDSQNAEATFADSEDSFVFVSVEKMPQFPGGDVALLKWISENINYPIIAAENGIQGRVACTFTVNTDGSITDVVVKRPLDPNLDAEAVRVLSNLPKFIPGENNGKVVRVLYSVPVRFSLSPSQTSKAPQSSQVAESPQSFQIDSEPKMDPNDPTVYISVENMPAFPGGDAALLKWISENVIYPEVAAQNGVQGRVSCNFIVEPDGSVTNVKVNKSLDPNLDAEAVRVLSTLPKFKPGTQKGKPVRVRYSVPVRFQLKK